MNGSKLDRWEWYGIISVNLATNYIGVNNLQPLLNFSWCSTRCVSSAVAK